MKNFTLLTILICGLFLVGCGKSEEVVPNNVRVARLLTGLGNRYWHLKAVYIDTTLQTLTDYQKTFTKTYTINAAAQASGTFRNSDNQDGTWEMNEAGTAWTEKFTTIAGVKVTMVYTIKSINETSFDATYTYTAVPNTSSTTPKPVREVYYAY